MTTKTDTPAKPIVHNVKVDNPHLYTQIHSGLVNLVHLLGVFVYGFLALAILALAAHAAEAQLALLATAGAAGLAWMSQSLWAFQQQQPASYVAWGSAALGVASAVLTYIGV